MLIGNVRYIQSDGSYTRDGDSDVTPEYAKRASRSTQDIVEWSCRNGDQSDVRLFRNGERVAE